MQQEAEGYDLGPNPAINFEDSFEGSMFEDVEPDAEEEDNDEPDNLDLKNMHPNLNPKPNRMDDDGNPFIAIVDVSGIHHLPVVGCSCQSSAKQDDILYLEMGLFPTSFQRIQTVFTFNVLTDFRLSNLECKTSAYQYYQKLRRVTCPAFPKTVPNRYAELRRLSRQYRNLKLWKMHGRAHDEPDATFDQTEISKQRSGAEEYKHLGKLALFCASCPQPGINLPENWKEDVNRSVCCGIQR